MGFLWHLTCPSSEDREKQDGTMFTWHDYAEFQILVNNHPEFNFVYSVQSVCVNLRTTQRIADYECEHIEADTIIFYIYSQIRQSGINDLVVIDDEDPDVVVLSAYVAHMINGPLAIKRKHSIINCRTLCPNDIAEGIDTASCSQWV